jgi:protein-tyrosine phosphatase
MDCDQICPNLFVGSYPQTLKEINALKAMDITAVLNLQTDDDERFLKIDWEVVRRRYQTCGIKVCRLPVRDFDPDDLEEKLPACVRELYDLLLARHVVYLHCTAGAGRSPTVAIAYLTWHRGMTLTGACDFVRSRRDCSPTIEAILRATPSAR